MPDSIASKHTDSSVFTLKFKRQYLPFLDLDDYNDIGDSLCSLAQPICCTLYVPCNLRVMDTCTVTEPIAQKQTHLYSIRLHDKKQMANEMRYLLECPCSCVIFYLCTLPHVFAGQQGRSWHPLQCLPFFVLFRQHSLFSSHGGGGEEEWGKYICCMHYSVWVVTTLYPIFHIF